jgi:hypothetical protein
MARGDPAKRFEDLVEYFRGGRNAAAIFYVRAKDRDPELTGVLRDYVRMVDGYIEAVKETYRLKREAGKPPPS